MAVGLAIAASVAIKLPELFGLNISGPDADTPFYARNFSLFVLPFLAGYFAWKRGLDRVGRCRLGAPFLAAALVVNILPFERGRSHRGAGRPAPSYRVVVDRRLRLRRRPMARS